MYQPPEVVPKCLASLQKQPYLKQGFGRSELSIKELADYGEVVGSMLIAAVVGEIRPGQEIPPEVKHRTQHLIHLVGSVDDATSNEFLRKIFGSDFIKYINIQKKMMNALHSGYNISVPREVTEEDIAQAAVIDAALVSRGRVYLASDEAQMTIWQQDVGEKGGCPLRHARRDGENDFDRLISAQLLGYAETGSYLGPAQFILKTVQAIKPDLRAYIINNYGEVTDWQLPHLAA